MEHLHFEFDSLSDVRAYVNPSPDPRLPYSVQTMGINVQGPRYFTDREGLDSFFLCMTLSGKGYVSCGGVQAELTAGRFFVVDCMNEHFYKTVTAPWRFLWMHFTGYGVRQYFRNLFSDGFYLDTSGQGEWVRSLYEEVLPLVTTPTAGGALRTSDCLHGMISHLALSRIEAEQSDIPQAILEAIRVISLNIAGDISVEWLAKNSHYSVGYFIKLFRRCTGLTPYQYILNLRLDNARNLLVSSNYPVEKVAACTGFSGSSRFIELFSQRYGKTPAAFKKQHGGMV